MARPPRSLAELILEFEHGKEHMRLVVAADHTPGYKDEYRIAQLGKNDLDEPTWTLVSTWRPKEVTNTTIGMLVSAIEHLIGEERLREIEQLRERHRAAAESSKRVHIANIGKNALEIERALRVHSEDDAVAFTREERLALLRNINGIRAALDHLP